MNINEFLNQPEVKINKESITKHYKGKTILVTGGAGSIGSAICRRMFDYDVKKIIAIDIDDTRLHELWLEMDENKHFESCLANLRDKDRLVEIFKTHRIDIIFHAGALKHVPLLELHPMEGIKTNIIGTYKLTRLAAFSPIEQFINISTDKASNPISMLGMTKYISEGLVSDISKYNVKTMSVRLGNIYGSRGSVVPIFENQIRKGGPILITDPKMERYFLTIENAVSRILQASLLNEKDDLFEFEMGEPINIVTLARYIMDSMYNSEIGSQIQFRPEINYIGFRPGEKLGEDLVGEKEKLVEIQNGIYKIEKQNNHIVNNIIKKLDTECLAVEDVINYFKEGN